MSRKPPIPTKPPIPIGVPFSEQVAEFEKQLLMTTLQACKWHRGHAAEVLGMSRQRFYQKLWQHQIIDRVHLLGSRVRPESQETNDNG